jgi:hypothetical protein
VEETVDKLCDRVLNSTFLEDKRAAVLGLKGLSKEYTLEVGTKGMPILISTLISPEYNSDIEMVKSILDALINICGDVDNGVQFTEIFIKDHKNLICVLNLLQETDFHIRYNCIELVKILLQNKRKLLQDSILTSGSGLSRLMDLLDDNREVIRNDGLLLLIDLTFQNSDIQKIVAFDNAFERLLQIVRNEGSVDQGELVVQDCLQLILNLLKDNVSNQNYFRESGLLSTIAPLFLLDIIPSSKDFPQVFSIFSTSTKWPLQKVKNVEMLLDILSLFVTSDNPNVLSNQKTIFNSKTLLPAIQIGLAFDSPPSVKSHALVLIADCIRKNEVNQEFLGKALVSPHEDSFPIPLIFELINVATASGTQNNDPLVRFCAVYVLDAYFQGNPNAQEVLISTLTPPPKTHDGHVAKSAGSLLL